MSNCIPSLASSVAKELEQLRISSTTATQLPPACLQLIHSLPGNDRCMDCGSFSPEWCSLSYGGLVCLQCSGVHRSFGVRISKVRSLYLDSWAPQDILALLEGGNGQLLQFFNRHGLTPDSSSSTNSGGGGASRSRLFLSYDNASLEIRVLRYFTKAALFYREQLPLHVSRVYTLGEYMGRKATRLPGKRAQSVILERQQSNTQLMATSG